MDYVARLGLGVPPLIHGLMWCGVEQIGDKVPLLMVNWCCFLLTCCVEGTILIAHSLFVMSAYFDTQLTL